jgi:hypothetical protein
MQHSNAVFTSIHPEAAARHLQNLHPDAETISKIIDRPKEMLALERARGTCTRSDIETLMLRLDFVRSSLQSTHPVTQATVVDMPKLRRNVESALVGKKVVYAVDSWHKHRLRKLRPSEIPPMLPFWSTNMGSAARQQMRYDIHFDFVEHACSPLLLKQEGIDAQEGPKRRRAEANGMANANRPGVYRMGIFNETRTKTGINEFLDEASSPRRAAGAVLRSILSGGHRDEQSLRDDHYQAFEQLRFFSFEEAAVESELHKRMRRKKYTWSEMQTGLTRKLNVATRFEKLVEGAMHERKKLLKRRGIKVDPDLLEQVS